MKPQVGHPRSFRTAAETPNQRGKIVLECFRLVEEILNEKAWPGPSFSAAPPESGAPDARAEEVGEELIAGGKHIFSQSLFVTPL